jgi:hypothetical protein
MRPEKHLTIPASIDAADADAKSLPKPSDRCRRRTTPSTRRLKGQFDGGWPSPRRKNHTERAERLDQLEGPDSLEQSCGLSLPTFLVTAPGFFTGTITLCAMMQTASPFG